MKVSQSYAHGPYREEVGTYLGALVKQLRGVLVILRVEIGHPLVHFLTWNLWNVCMVAADPGGLDQLPRPERLDAEGSADLGIPDALGLVERASRKGRRVEDVEVELAGKLSHMCRQHVSC